MVKKKWLLLCLLLSFQSLLYSQPIKNSAYLFVYFISGGKDAEAIRFAWSHDGYQFRALNGNKPVLSSQKISSAGGVRDPHILRGADGKTFYMVATDMVAANGWNSNRAMVLLKSTDLINWTSSVVNIQKRFAGNDSLLRVWAPQTIYDKKKGKYMIYFSMKHGQDPDKIYYAYANKDFTDLEAEPKQLFYNPTNGACIDGDIIYKDGKYHLFFKTESEGAGIKMAISDKLTEGYVLNDRYLQQTKDPVEGAGIYKLNNGDGYILMYDVYKSGRYQFTRTKDFIHYTVVDENMLLNFRPRHGTVMPITEVELSGLINKWSFESDVVTAPQSKSVKIKNLYFDSAANKIIIPVKPGTSLKSFDPQFLNYPGISVSPKGPQNFLNKPVTYSVAKKGKMPVNYEVHVKQYGNIVLPGFYADPDILYAEKTKRFYIYPTSDGFNNWSGTYFKAFSSADLVNWKDEGVILDVANIPWGKRNAWAPAVIEKKIKGVYKYFYYFCAAQKIGVAVSDNPAGPFIDSGKPLMELRPEGINRGQVIDPDVFTDPKTGKTYLYWGNGFMAGAELNDDMLSLKQETVTLLTPDSTFREGAHVFFRDGIYYFTWSQNDTRSEDYRVRYATSNSPLGKLTIPENNLVIAKDVARGIYGTGHHSVIQIPGKDEWFIVYHRFNYPNGIAMGAAAGYNREVCIDQLEFETDGSIKRVTPTHEGILSIKK